MSAQTKQSGWFDDEEYCVVKYDGGYILFVTNGSRIYRLGDEAGTLLEGLSSSGNKLDRRFVLSRLGVEPSLAVNMAAPREPPLRSLSLAVAEKCNLACGYCYAEGGTFGGKPRDMSIAMAESAVVRLFESTEPGDRVNLSFLGGEPLANRKAIHHATRLARQHAEASGVELGFSITTNGTLVTREDIDFFDEHGFAVTVSLDGAKESHDRLRPLKGGGGSFDRIVSRISPLLDRASHGNVEVSARVTVTPANQELRETLCDLLGLGFKSVGFSPMLVSPTGESQMSTVDMRSMLLEMIRCGDDQKRTLPTDGFTRFSNLATALSELQRGTHRPYPCGAGASYFGVGADGDMYACHRFVGDQRASMGSLREGVDRGRQKAWLEERHVLTQEPCKSCWARFLCGGGCHHEVINRGREACEYIRGWLEYCLSVYAWASDRCPAALQTSA